MIQSTTFGVLRGHITRFTLNTTEFSMRTPEFVVPLLLLVAVGCTDRPAATSPDAAPAQLTVSERPELREARAGAVFLMSNSAVANEVIVYPRGRDGKLGAPTSYATGGRGTGGGLGNQYGLILDDERLALYTVNAGSDEITAFGVDGASMTFRQSVPSGGNEPISLALHDDLLYVLNDGATANISGFRIGRNGRLTPLSGSARARSAPAGKVDGAQISFSPDGRTLVVTEKAANLIVTYPVLENGRTGEPRVLRSNGDTPFGFDFTRGGKLIVSEAFGGAVGASAVSSYSLTRASRLKLVSGSVANGESAVCWIATTRDGRFAIATNTNSNTINTYAVTRDGALTFVTGSVTATGMGPTDLALSRADRYLYVRNGGSNSISILMPESDGSFTTLGTVDGLPKGANGMAAR